MSKNSARSAARRLRRKARVAGAAQAVARGAVRAIDYVSVVPLSQRRLTRSVRSEDSQWLRRLKVASAIGPLLHYNGKRVVYRVKPTPIGGRAFAPYNLTPGEARKLAQFGLLANRFGRVYRAGSPLPPSAGITGSLSQGPVFDRDDAAAYDAWQAGRAVHGPRYVPRYADGNVIKQRDPGAAEVAARWFARCTGGHWSFGTKRQEAKV